MRYLLFISIAILNYSCNPEPINDEIGIWRLIPEDRIEGYDLEVLDFRSNGSLTMDVDKKPYGSFDAKIEAKYIIAEWEGQDAISISFGNSQNYLQAFYPEIEPEKLTLTEIRADKRTFRYTRIK